VAGSRKVISFFLASPGDLIPERKIAKKVSDELNSMLSIKFNVHIELVGWEDTVSSAGRPQEIINRDLERCDIFIGLLWKRWGSSPDNEGKYESGFEEEFTIATNGFRRNKKPLISLFFKKIDSQALSDPGAQLQKVLDFRRKTIDEKAFLFQEFIGDQDFESLIRKCISNYVLDHVDIADPQPQATQTPKAETSEGQKAKDENTSFEYGPIQGKSANFIDSVLRRRGDASSRAKLEAFEVARLRLISSSLGDGQNDSSSIGVHDANLIYHNKNKCDFDNSELFSILLAGVKNLQHENIPLWYWLYHPSNKNISLNLLTLIVSDRNESSVASIIDMMTFADIDITTNDVLDRAAYINNWLGEKRSPSVRNSALRYLSRKGTQEDLQAVRKEIGENSSQTTALANEAYISIRLKNGIKSGLEAINELQPAVLSTEIIDSIFEGHSHISTEDLHETFKNRNKLVRAKALEVLSSRNLLSPQQIEIAQQDPEPNIRQLAVLASLAQGVTLSEEEAKAIIMKDVSKPTNDEDVAWARTKLEILSTLDSAELERKHHRLFPLEADAYIVLCRRKFDARRAELSENILDNFDKFTEAQLKSWAEVNSNDPESLIKQLDSIRSYLKIKFTREALSLMVEKKSKRDISTIRQALTSNSVKPTEEDFEYFYSHGEWHDTPLLVDLFKRAGATSNTSLLGMTTAPKGIMKLAVKTILKLGRDRIADILALECPNSIKSNLISSMRDKDFAGIGDDSIISLLKNESDEIRKHSALKCAKVLPKKKVKMLLDTYGDEERTYYNVIHWLDFGLYSPKEQVNSVCKKTFLL